MSIEQTLIRYICDATYCLLLITDYTATKINNNETIIWRCRLNRYAPLYLIVLMEGLPVEIFMRKFLP